MILGIGIDILEIERLEKILRKRGHFFLEKIFNKQEIDYCSSKRKPAQHLAARFCAKEALLKALGTGIGKGWGLKEIAVVNLPHGQPEFLLPERMRCYFEEIKVKKIHISMSHSESLAVAYVIIEAH